jgi:hypothetical protein
VTGPGLALVEATWLLVTGPGLALVEAFMLLVGVDGSTLLTETSNHGDVSFFPLLFLQEETIKTIFI